MRRRREPVAWDANASDEELAGWAQRGELEAFGVLYDRHFAAVYGYCFRRLGEREAAQDAAAETFRKALSALPSYRSHAFRGWLFVIARHVVIDCVRAGPRPLRLDAADDFPQPGASIEDLAIATTQLETLTSVLTRLTPAQHEAVTLRLAGLRPAEIGIVLGKSRSAIDMTLHRAVLHLRELMLEPAPQAGSDRRA